MLSFYVCIIHPKAVKEAMHCDTSGNAGSTADSVEFPEGMRLI
jgi:hypothetical protein